jgi:catechol 2,3-dioxygenase-like lactoylglutathione lyase family enzyme
MEWNKMVPELTVFDFEKSLKFYTEILGFSIKFGKPEENFAYLDQEGVQIMLELPFCQQTTETILFGQSTCAVRNC